MLLLLCMFDLYNRCLIKINDCWNFSIYRVLYMLKYNFYSKVKLLKHNCEKFLKWKWVKDSVFWRRFVENFKRNITNNIMWYVWLYDKRNKKLMQLLKKKNDVFWKCFVIANVNAKKRVKNLMLLLKTMLINWYFESWLLQDDWILQTVEITQ